MATERTFFLDAELTEGQQLVLPHAVQRRITRVLRLKEGSGCTVFNGRQGAYAATLGPQGKTLHLGTCIKEFKQTSQVTLMVGLPKRETMDRILRQATEMGVAKIQPILTTYTVPDKLNQERAQAIIIEAAEQCERLDLPILEPLKPLREAMTEVSETVLWCDERGTAKVSQNTAQTLLVGPEGGFAPEEKEFLHQQSHVLAVTYGTTILRVDTAVVTGLAHMLT